MEEVNICLKVIERILYLKKIGAKITHESQQTHLEIIYFTYHLLKHTIVFLV